MTHTTATGRGGASERRVRGSAAGSGWLFDSRAAHPEQHDHQTLAGYVAIHVRRIASSSMATAVMHAQQSRHDSGWSASAQPTPTHIGAVAASSSGSQLHTQPRPDEEHEEWAKEVSGVMSDKATAAGRVHDAHGQPQQTAPQHALSLPIIPPQSKLEMLQDQLAHIHQQQNQAAHQQQVAQQQQQAYLHRLDQEQQMQRLLQQQAQIQAQQNALFLQQQQLHLSQPMYIPAPQPIAFESNLAPPPTHFSAAPGVPMLDTSFPAPMHDPNMERAPSRKRERGGDGSGGPSSGTQTPGGHPGMHMPDRPYSAAAAYRSQEADRRIEQPFPAPYMQQPHPQMQMQQPYYPQLQPPPMQMQSQQQMIPRPLYPSDDSEQMQKRSRSASYNGAVYPNGAVDGAAAAAAPMLLLAEDGSVRLDADGKPLRRPTMHRRRRTEELLPHEVWTCANIDPETKLPCSKTYRTSSSRSIHKHEAACKFKPPEGSVPPGDGKRKQKTRRKSYELAAHERWNCPFLCGRYFRTTSTKSIHLHRMTCPSRPGGPVPVNDADRVASQADVQKSLQKKELGKLSRARDKQQQQQQAAGAGSNKPGTRSGGVRRAPRKQSSASESEHSDCSDASDEDEEEVQPPVKPESALPFSPVRRMSFPDLYAPTTAAAAAAPLTTPTLENFDDTVLPVLPAQSGPQQNLPQQLLQQAPLMMQQAQLQPTYMTQPTMQPMQPMVMHPGGFKVDPPSAAYASVSAAAAHTAQQIAAIQEKLMELQQLHSTGQDSRTVSHELRTLQRSIQQTTQQLAEQLRQQREFEEQRQRHLMQPLPQLQQPLTPQLYAPLPPPVPVIDHAASEAAMLRLLMQQKEIENNMALHKAQHLQAVQQHQQLQQQQLQQQQQQQQSQPQVVAAAAAATAAGSNSNPPSAGSVSVSPHEPVSRPSSTSSMHELSNGITSLTWKQQQQQQAAASLPPYLPLPGQSAASVSTAHITSGAASSTTDESREPSVASESVRSRCLGEVAVS